MYFPDVRKASFDSASAPCQSSTTPNVLKFLLVDQELSKSEIYAVASLQKVIIVTAALNFLPPVLAIFGTPLEVLACIKIVITIGVFFKAKSIGGLRAGFTIAALSLLMNVGFIVLVVLSQRATRLLKMHDVKAGFFGADTKALEIHPWQRTDL